MDASSGKVQKASTHHACLVRIHVGVNQRCRALDVDPPTLPAARTNVSLHRAMDESSGKVYKASTHVACGVVMDIAAFKVSHSVGIDEDATALPAARTRSASIGAMDES